MTDFYSAAPGEVSPPVPSGPRLCDGFDMRVVHSAFLWGYGEAPGLIRTTPAGDVARAEFVGKWLSDLGASLHGHHGSEDDLLWDRLEKRAPACALHVAQMRGHHAKVTELMVRSAPLLADWRETADPSTGEELALAYEELLAVLRLHLRREVVEIVPVLEKVIHQNEWEELAKHSTKQIPMTRLLPQLGMLLANSSPAEAAKFLAAIPPPIRLIYRLIGRRQYELQFRRLFPGKPVPKTF